ncbi:hypothetical protein GOV06_04915 [Candidatus Woesearchaeota archaeon]|nr:hypothetical protein [Candidatus Woesearchaeota archaeon]
MKFLKKETHNKLKKAQLFVAISLLLVSSLMLFRNTGITGHFSADFMSQIVDLKIEESQSYSLSSDNTEPIYISSLRLSGNIIGYGSVEIFIEDKGERFLVYSNVGEKEQGMPAITGMAVVQAAGTQTESDSTLEPEESVAILVDYLETIRWEGRVSLSENEEYLMGVFNNKCVDTCFMEMPLSSKERYKLIFMVEPGTKVEITKITYTLKNQDI